MAWHRREWQKGVPTHRLMGSWTLTIWLGDKLQAFEAKKLWFTLCEEDKKNTQKRKERKKEGKKKVKKKKKGRRKKHNYIQVLQIN